jgi:pyruvate kinase
VRHRRSIERSKLVRRTKIICTIGPATESIEMLMRLAAAGMNAVRLNMSHGDHESHARVIAAIKQLNNSLPYPLAIILDTQGPEIRTGTLRHDLQLRDGDIITVNVRSDASVEETSFQIHYEDLLQTVEPGHRISVDNGLINLEVLEKLPRSLRCRVVDGGTLKSRRHVNLPGIKVNLPAITKKDERDIIFGVKHGIDYVALSFVREAQDVQQLRELLRRRGAETVKIIAKIEDQEGVRNIESIIDAADAIMVARGDLGVEILLEQLPNVQRKIVRLCAEQGKRVIVATHLLESMIVNPMPTRAEVTDVANAVYEEVDAIMLSGETTIGKYPVRCVEFLDRIAVEAERSTGLRFCARLNVDVDKQHMAASAVQLAEALKVDGMVVITRRGLMANYIANCRPRRPTIFAFSCDLHTCQQLALNYGTRAYHIGSYDDPEQTLAEAFAQLRDTGLLAAGAKVVVLSDILAADGIDAVLVREIPPRGV